MTRTSDTVDKQRKIQDEQSQADTRKRDENEQAKSTEQADDGPAPIQTGQRPYPGKPPAQSLTKPGQEADMAMAPLYDAPAYRGSDKLKGFATLITGGDSGIGRSVAVLFAREGADVAIVYLSEHEDAEQTRKAVQAEGQRCLLIPGDVKDPVFCEKAVQQAVSEFGHLDVLVNNAAFQQHAEDIGDLSNERFDETLRTNVTGYFQMARAAVPHLRAGGSIINTGSVVGLQGSANLLDYATTKGAIHAFTKSLAQNLISKSIRVNAVAPGPVWTPLNPADRPASELPEFGAQTEFHRPAQPEEIAPAYVFLASPITGSYITGIVLPITGKVGAI